MLYTGSWPPLRPGVVVRFDGRRGVWIRIVKRTWHGRGLAPGTVHIDTLSRVVAVSHALKAAVVRRLRQHVPRRPRPAELRRRELRRLRRAAEEITWRDRMAAPITPEMTLIEAGISDARQTEYQRKMSMLLAGNATDSTDPSREL